MSLKMFQREKLYHNFFNTDVARNKETLLKLWEAKLFKFQ